MREDPAKVKKLLDEFTKSNLSFTQHNSGRSVRSSLIQTAIVITKMVPDCGARKEAIKHLKLAMFWALHGIEHAWEGKPLNKIKDHEAPQVSVPDLGEEDQPETKKSDSSGSSSDS